ncbi:HAD-IA family hydrolase [Lysinibacillus irui]|uniref:HAD-IA family hydrolase n=1 Tax=Lysinibacillus irui TaxID=2998077 RepID=A0ABU5NNR3_9BACI|nr:MULTISPECIES: HAD-IA family hydrolase [Lysinibacillus]MEA0555325.1 HAD-IA family hydrolase [Lysinibacillus irui]MEA0977667.1 HAD-IA family hydrolase [Lysinibacillus irui]MEA1043821.1 HAD-IA family hydrolase [Lysinibacillus irui]
MTQVEWVIFDKDGTIIEMDSLWIAWAKNVYLNLTENSNFEILFSLQTFLKNIGVDDKGTSIDPTSPLAIGSIQEAETIVAYLLYQQGIPWSKGVTLARAASNLATSQQENSRVQALPGIRTLLMNLKKQGIKLGVITADQTARAISHLQQLELFTLFEFVLGSDQAVYSKPFPDLAYVAKEQFQVTLERTVMIGDSNADMLFAKNAGMCFSIGIIPKATFPKDYLPDATKIIDAYDESVLTMLIKKE